MRRRIFLRSLGSASALPALAAGRTVAAASSDVDNGRLAFVYHDGPREDYTKALPVHREENVPASVGVVSDWVGEDGRCGVSELREMERAGFEIMSHTTAHRSLVAYDVVEDVDEGDERIYPAEPHHAYDPGGEVEITDGDASVVRTIAGSGEDDAGTYMELETPVDRSFDADAGVVERYTPSYIRGLLAESRRALRSMGFEVDNLLAPYDDISMYSLRFVPDYYDGIANAVAEDAINPADGVDPYRIDHRYFVEYTSRATVQRRLDRVAAEGAFGVFGAHTSKDVVTRDRIREAIGWAKERDVEIVTLREGLVDLGAVDGARATTTATRTRTPTTSTTTEPPTSTTSPPASTATASPPSDTTSTAAPTTSTNAGPSTTDGTNATTQSDERDAGPAWLARVGRNDLAATGVASLAAGAALLFGRQRDD